MSIKQITKLRYKTKDKPPMEGVPLLGYNKSKSMNNIKIILIMLKYKYIPSSSHGYTYSYSSGGDVLYSTSHSILV